MAKKTAAELQHEIIGAVAAGDDSFAYNSHEGAKWFENGGNLGLFIHFGICAVNGTVDLSWGMMANKPWEQADGVDYTITPREYFNLAKSFKPQNYNPEDFIAKIKEAGFNYAVLTTRHHDGFALWPSEYGDFNTKNYFGGADLVKKFTDACRKYDIKVGLYYSPPDWYYNREYMSFNYGSKASGALSSGYSDRQQLDIDHKPCVVKEKPDGFDKAFAEYLNGQIGELIHNYGQIDMLWFDGSIKNYEDVISIEEIRKAQPQIIVNPRLHHKGDFVTFEGSMPKEKPTAKVWEHEGLWAEGPWWAVMEQSKNYKPADWFLKTFDTVKGWGGNFLVNIGLNKDGTAPRLFYERINEVIDKQCK